MSSFETFRHDNEFSKVEEAQYEPTTGFEVHSPEEAGKLKNGMESVNIVAEPDTKGASKLSGKDRDAIALQDSEDRDSADKLMNHITNPDAGWPPVPRNEKSHAIGISDTSGSITKVNIGKTEGGIGGEAQFA